MFVGAIAVTCIAGSGLMWINGQGNIAASLRNAPAADTLVILVGVSSVAGRLFTGFLSDWLAPKGVPRAIYLVPSAAIMALSHLFFAFFQDAMLYPTAVFTGYAYGTMFSVTVTVLPLYFGKRWMATCNAVLAIFAAVGGVSMGLVTRRRQDQVAFLLITRARRSMVTCTVCMPTQRATASAYVSLNIMRVGRFTDCCSAGGMLPEFFHR